MMYIQNCLVVTWLIPLKTVAISACSVYTIQPCIMSCHFMLSHIHRVHACLAVTCHLTFGRMTRKFYVTAVTRGWNDGNKSQHRKLALEMKILLPLLLGLEPATC